MITRKQRSLLLLLTTLAALACAPLFQPAAPTLDPNSLQTVIAGTAQSAATQTALLTPPTWTAIPGIFPTATVEASPTVTETFVFLVFSPTPTATQPPTEAATENYSCRITAQSPANGTVLNRRTDFTAKWSLTNNGLRAWDANNSDYVFVSGADLHKRGGYDLSFTVEPGKTIDINVDMSTPNQKGEYSTVWELRVDNVRFCRMRISIVVE
jgi:hypothetical protein